MEMVTCIKQTKIIRKNMHNRLIRDHPHHALP